MTKFAVYYIPQEDDVFYRLGTQILGYDVRARTTVALPTDLREQLGQFDATWGACCCSLTPGASVRAVRVANGAFRLSPGSDGQRGQLACLPGVSSSLTICPLRGIRYQSCAIYENLNFYQTSNPKEYPLAPDIAVIKGVPFRHLRSWRVGKTGPAPHVVFEIASEETWKKDLEEKPVKYALMGVEEYFAYDPNDPPRTTTRRLFGWQLDKGRQVTRELPMEPGGRLWSPHLDSFLVPEGEYLRLYDRHGQLCLTEAEAEAETRQAQTRRAEALAEKLRSLGIDPDQV